MYALIWLKVGTCLGGLNVSASIKFKVNLMNIQQAISDFMHSAKLSFCHTYRVICFEEQAENQYVARLNITRVSFGGYKLIE